MARLGAVCILHGGAPLPSWVLALSGRLRLVVVLNDPADHDYAALPHGVRVLRNAHPRGFAANVNAGTACLAADEPDAVLLVNFDLEASPSVVDDLWAVLEAHPHAAAAAPLLTDLTGAPVLSAGTLPGPVREFTRAAGLRTPARVRLLRSVLRRLPAYRRRNAGAGTRVLGSQEYLPFTCVLVRSAAWTDVGPLDERFRLYAEDVDWGVRARQHGWQLVLTSPSSPVVHAERATASPTTDAWYEASHRALHEKWGWTGPARAQQWGLALRLRAPWLVRAPELDRSQL